MGLVQKQQQFTMMLAHLIRWAYGNGYEITLGEVMRTKEQQERNIARGVSKTMRSKHLNCLAVDIKLYKNGKYARDGESYRPLGEHWEKQGGRWGGRFGVAKKDYDTKIGWDAGHLELH